MSHADISEIIVHAINKAYHSPASIPDGWFSYLDTQLYANLLARLPNHATFAEIGVWQGRSLCSVSEIIKCKNLQVIAIDTFQGTLHETAHSSAISTGLNLKEKFTENLHHFALESFVKIIPMHSHKAAHLIPDNSLDLVFIDGDHSRAGVLSDIKVYYNKLKNDGIMLGHDYLWDDIKNAVHEIFPYGLHVDNNMWYIHKKDINVQKIHNIQNKEKTYSIIIPTHNHLHDCLRPCLESIFANTSLVDTEIVVVANGCHDGTKEYLHSLADKVRTVWVDEQLGYVKATNLGIRAALGEYIILLNNDVVIHSREWIQMLQKPLENPKVAVSGPRKAYNEIVNSEYMLFFCVMIPRMVFENVGILDENFGIGYHEDVDFCVRCIKAGYSLVEVPQNINYDANNKGNASRGGAFPIYHKGGATFSAIFGDSKERLEMHADYLRLKHECSTYTKEFLTECIDKALRGQSNVASEVLNLNGMSSVAFRHLLNNICAKNNIKYLECGSWKGSTACSALSNNKNTTGYLVENFSQFTDMQGEGHPQDFLFANLEKYAEKNYTVIQKDFFTQFDAKDLQNIDVFFYDGAHGFDEHYNALGRALPCLNDYFVFIVDDHQWPTVNQATKKSIDDLINNQQIEKICEFVLDSETPPKEVWWYGWIDGATNFTGLWRNGIYLGLFKKKQQIKAKEKITIGYIDHNQAIFERYLKPSVDRLNAENYDLISVKATGRAAEDYNKIVALSQNKYILLVHEDVGFGSDIIDNIHASIACDPKFGAMGMVGFDYANNTVWSDSNQLKQIERCDACCILINKEHGIKFDSTTFDELHGYVEDFCMQAIYNHGLKCYTLKYDNSQHENSENLDLNRSYIKHYGFSYRENGNKMWGKYDQYNEKLIQKWRAPKIYDCFMFYNELDLLEIRLNELHDVVDYFVLVESKYTFQGNSKPSFYQQNKERFAKFTHKIIHLVMEDMPQVENQWSIEIAQRNFCLSNLNCFTKDDIIILTDADEIINKTAIYKYKSLNGIYNIEMKLYYYYLDVEVEGIRWKAPKICRYKDVMKMEANTVRSITDGVDTIMDGGWHFSYLGNADQIIQKIQAFSHTEFNNDVFVNKQKIQHKLRNLEDIFDRASTLKVCDSYVSLPGYVYNNLTQFQNMLYRKNDMEEKSKVYDCFIFFNELDLLEIRLQELNDVVDRFVLVEARYTHQGNQKPLYFAENRLRFAQFLHKIEHIVVDEFPDTDDAHGVREPFQRNAMLPYLNRVCNANDIIILSDIDEIPRSSIVGQYSVDMGLTCIQTDLFYYRLNMLSSEKWYKLRIFPYSEIGDGDIQQFRGRRDYEYKNIIQNGGWHFSFLGNNIDIKTKIESYSHPEYNLETIKSDQNITNCIKNGKDVFGRNITYKTISITQDFPKCVYNNLALYEKKGLIAQIELSVPDILREYSPGAFDEICNVNVYCIEQDDIKDKFIIDIGANRGIFSCYSIYLGAKACYAFEPHKDAFAKQIELVQKLGYSNSINSFNLAVLDGLVHEVTISDEDFVSNIWSSTGAVKVKCISLADAIMHAPIEVNNFVLKMDCEGSEFNIIYNTPKHIFDRIQSILIEIHDQSNPDYCGKGEELISYMQNLGYKIDKTGPQAGWFSIDGHFTPSSAKCLKLKKIDNLPDGWFGENDIKFYKKAYLEVPNGGTIAEIGVWMGRSICSVAEIIKAKNLKVFAIDSFEGSTNENTYDEILKTKDVEKIFKFNLQRFDLHNHVVTRRKYSQQAAAEFADKTFDFIFIDGDHSYDGVTNDLRAWISKLKNGGVIAGHDYGWHAGVAKAVNDFFNFNVGCYDNIWFCKIDDVDSYINKSKKSETPEVSIIIPTYNHLNDCLKPCIESIMKNTDMSKVEVIVVANGCIDGTKDYITSLGDPFKLIWIDEAAGYPRATNAGIRAAQGEFIVLLNNDTMILDMQNKHEWIDMLKKPLIDDSKVGLTGPLKGTCPFLNGEEAEHAPFIIFFCVMMRKSTFDELGLLDEDFSPGGGEDTAWSWKALQAGYQIVQVPVEGNLHTGTKYGRGVFPIFHNPGSTRGDDWDLLRRNNLKLIQKFATKNLKLHFTHQQPCSGFFSVSNVHPLANLNLSPTAIDLKDETASSIIIQEQYTLNNLDKFISECKRVLKENSGLRIHCKMQESKYVEHLLRLHNFEITATHAVTESDGIKTVIDSVKKNSIKSRVYDCFSFFNELDLLEIRLHELNDYVDYFVIVEMTVTHQGDKKPLYFAENKNRFAKFLHKIIHVVVDDCYETPDPWIREHYQRNCIAKALQKCTDDDIIIISDADEIPRGSAINEFDTSKPWMYFEQRQLNFYMNSEAKQFDPAPGIFSRIIQYGTMRNLNLNPTDVRYRNIDTILCIKDGGWHFTWLGGSEKIVAKLESFAHKEINLERYKNIDNIQKNIEQNLDAFGRSAKKITKFVDLDDTYPLYIRANMPKYIAAGYINTAKLFDKIAIVMPYYNDIRFVTQAVEHILNQTYQNWELYIVDDGSEVSKAVRNILNIQDARIILLEKNNNGPSSARNLGLRKILKGNYSYVAYCDSDDIWPANYLESQLANLKNCDFSYTSADNYFEDGTVAIPYGIPDPEDYPGFEFMLNSPFIYISGVMHKIKCLEVGLFDEELDSIEDWDMWLRIARSGYKINKNKLTKILYIVKHNSTMSAKRTPEKHQKLLNKHMKHEVV